MYFVDRKKIEKTLSYMETTLRHFPNIEQADTLTNQLAIERLASVTIESIIDVGNSMIDGFIMRDPGGYEDIIDILEDEKVVNNGHALALKRVIQERKQLVQQFYEVDHKRLVEVFKANQEALLQFPIEVRRYLETELGPVSAFLPED
ncbi:DUF86 domain-containing protein [Bacillus suaedae]|uniref:DUF86 domain-containing protein n=1 Tax=Halalkalibacter suaedae TaxID=2822140 RepID=A0A940WSL8_9BACI|nr:DUF86 domain-containing protein [Bacillus suaedae]MBP3949907.1 DUF86 domain-containing protein [Bacillus suaedae]